MEPTVACHDASKIYNRGQGGGLFSRQPSDQPVVTALASITMSVSRGEFVGIIGPSGSGKSTLLHLLAGIDVPTHGTVELAGQPLSAFGERERTRLRLDHVGIVFQRFHLLASLSARANVALPLIELGRPKPARRQRAADLLDRMGLAQRKSHYPGQLSGGEQQRVAVARAMVTDPDLLLADEPTGELDTDTGAKIIDLLQSMADSRAVIVASHDHNVIEAVDRVVRLRDGRIME